MDSNENVRRYKVKQHIMKISILFACSIMLMACSSMMFTENNDTNNDANENLFNDNNNEVQNSTNNTEDNQNSNNNSHMPNVPDGPNVPDTPEGASPNVPDGPNIPDCPEYETPNITDFPDVDLPNVKIEGDEEEITMQVPDGLLFDFDQHELRSEAKETLDEVAKALEQYDGSDVQINGHTDNQSDEEYNMNLSEKRATSVEDYLYNEGALDNVNAKTKGYGDTKPIASNDDEEGRQKNRRVEVVIDTPDES